MSPPNENRVERIVPATLPPMPARQAVRKPPDTSLGVMDTLLGKNDLAALEEGGRDPYNATGRQFRR